MQKFRGIVVYLNEGAERTYGFISPAGSDGSRASNVWFGNTSLGGQNIEVGDEVDFCEFKRPNVTHPHKAAWRVWIRKPCSDPDRITNLPGEFDL